MSGPTRTALTTVALLLAVVSGIAALEKTVSLGRDHLWRELATTEGVTLEPGAGGFPILALQTDQYTPTPATDLLLHFNGGTPTDSSGNYRTISSSISTSRRWAHLGTAAGVFQGQQEAVTLAPATAKALFADGRSVHDFTLEFWLYPATLSEDETILLWQGARKTGETVLPQSIRCAIQSSRMTWTFDNFFQPEAGAAFSVSLRGAEDLIPRQWHHYTLRFDGHTGMIEYLVDGKPQAITYANNAGRENGTVFEPSIGSAAESRLTIGSGFTGFLDELRISREFVSKPIHSRYSQTPGTAVTDPIDLGYTDSTIDSISAVNTDPGNTAVFYYYRTSNVMSAPKQLSAKWNQFAPNQPLPSPPSGRYVQFKIELLPDGTGNHTPTVSDLSFSYQPRLPPPAPSLLTATPGNGQIRLSWRKVVDPNLKGYELFYGDRPGQYFGTGSSSGSSPVDVGNTTSFDLKGLSNGKLYYFAVVAYDTSKPAHLSAFSNEVAARPSTIAGGAK